MKTKVILPLLILFFILFSCTTSDDIVIITEIEKEITSDGEIDQIKEWFNFLCSNDLGGRYSGSEGIKKAANYIESVINNNVLERQVFEAKSTTMENLIYKINGETDSLIVFGAHYDAAGFLDKVAKPGADDNISGVAVLLRMIKLTQKLDLKPHYSISFCFFDGEEIGMLGAWNFVSTNKDPIKLYVNVDTCGSINDYELTLSYNSLFPDLKEQYSSLASDIESLPIMEYAPLGYATDCSAFKSQRFIAIGPLTIPSYLHTMDDNTSNISFARVDRISKALMPIVNQL